MSRWIDADVLVKWLCGNKCGCERNECGYTIPCQQVQLLEGAPSIDIVRCKECRHKDEIVNYCYENDRDVESDDFCSYGERGDAE